MVIAVDFLFLGFGLLSTILCSLALLFREPCLRLIKLVELWDYDDGRRRAIFVFVCFFGVGMSLLVVLSSLT